MSRQKPDKDGKYGWIKNVSEALANIAQAIWVVLRITDGL